jgi:glucokinase
VRYAVGVDIGCTNIRAGLSDETGRLCTAVRRPAEVHRGPEHVLETAWALAREVMARGGDAEIVAVGVGAPGAIGSLSGTVVDATRNLPGWKGFPLGPRLSTLLGLPVVVGNDTNVIAMGEHAYGAARGIDDFVTLALGSGVGGSVFLGGRPHRGVRSLAGHLGHISVDPNGRLCNCGRQGCLEAYASAWSIAERAQTRLLAGAGSLMTEMAGGDPSAVTSETVLRAAWEGDLLALTIVGEVTRALACVIADLCNALDPSLFVLTGGVVHGNPALIERVRTELAVLGSVHEWEPPPVVAGALADDAGVLGGAAMAFEWGEESAPRESRDRGALHACYPRT